MLINLNLLKRFQVIFLILLLVEFNFLDTNMVRPCWDKYFLRLADLVATRTNCMKRAVGAVIVNDFRIVSTGYNGTPFGVTNCNDGGCERCNSFTSEGKDLESCICIHAETNAVLEGGRKRTKGSTIYLTCFPCLGCAKLLI